MNILELLHVKKSFGNREVLRDLCFSVPEHTVFGFVGGNGAGKTTTMKIILGLLESDGGSVLVNGEKVCFGQTKTNRFIGYLPDVPEFYSFMTPVEYMLFCGEISGMKRATAEEKTSELLSLVGLSGENHRIRGFSRGMKQRLGIAQALLNDPLLLICDEPTSALDPVGRKEILDILVSAKQKTTVVFSTHILSDVERICDNIAFLNEGKIALEGTLEQVKLHRRSAGFELELEDPADADFFRGQFGNVTELSRSHLLFGDGNDINGVMRVLSERNIPFVKLEKNEPTLESVFMEVIGK